MQKRFVPQSKINLKILMTEIAQRECCVVQCEATMISHNPATTILAATNELCDAVDALRFDAPIANVYNPLRYAAQPHHRYIENFANSKKKVLILGMNPGPYGMAQTGVPFGEVAAVRDWLGITDSVGKPECENPKKLVTGFACPRSEVSGRRLWGAIAEHWNTPKCFFHEHFVANYCPLLFLEVSGRNITPDKLRASEREALYAACNDFLRVLVEVLEPKWIIGVGGFAEARAKEALPDFSGKIGRILHPSPANPRANRDWVGSVKRELKELGVCD